jgi:uncharacterized damage-inducible protein DinB
MMSTDPWIVATVDAIDGYRRMIDGAVRQLSDEEFTRRPAEMINSVAVVMRHLGGNLLSRWTDFLTTDGEKPNRNRDTEFEDWPGDRASLLAFFDSGWKACRDSIAALTTDDVTKSIEIRGEKHTVPQAIQRSLTHTAYHAGQIMLIARTVHDGSWQWLTIKPGGSQQHNQQTWGTAEARGATGRTP